MTQRILILSHDNKIGDAIVATGLFKPLRAHWPDCEIGVLCGPSNAEIYRHHPDIKWLHVSRSRNVFARIWASLQARWVGYDIAVHFGLDLDNPSLKIVLNLVNAKQRFLFSNDSVKPHSNDTVIQGNWHNSHYSVRHQYFLQAVGSSFEKYQYDVCLSNESPPTKTKYSSLHLVINSQSSTLNRSLSVFWLREFVLEALKQHSDIQVQLLSANKAHQVEQQRTFADLSNRVSVTDSQPSVSHSLTVIQTADLILSPDTYAVHAAGAWNIPVIALYEPNSSTMDLWGPASDSYVQICAPTGKAVSDIGIEHVAEALAQLLKTAALRERVLLK